MTNQEVIIEAIKVGAKKVEIVNNEIVFVNSSNEDIKKVSANAELPENETRFNGDGLEISKSDFRELKMNGAACASFRIEFADHAQPIPTFFITL